MKIVDIHEAKTQLFRLVQLAVRGDEVIIGKAGVPLARLVPVESSTAPRTGGQWRGQVWVSGDFDRLPADLEAVFRGKSG